MSDKEACLVDCVAYHKSIGCSYKLLCHFLHRELPADVCRYFWPTINLVSLVFNVLVAGQPGWPEVPHYNCALNHPPPKHFLLPRGNVWNQITLECMIT